MTQLVRVCKYGCKNELGDFDKKENKYLELDGTLHTRERCQSLKQVPKGHTDLSVEVLLKKLETLGIKIDLQVIRNL
jgi:hypothetical protein